MDTTSPILTSLSATQALLRHDNDTIEELLSGDVTDNLAGLLSLNTMLLQMLATAQHRTPDQVADSIRAALIWQADAPSR